MVRLVSGGLVLLVVLAFALFASTASDIPNEVLGISVAIVISAALFAVLIGRIVGARTRGTLSVTPQGLSQSGIDPRTAPVESIHHVLDEGLTAPGTLHPARSRCRRWRIECQNQSDWLIDDNLWQATINTMTATYRPPDHPDKTKIVTVGDALKYCGLRS